MCQEDIVAVTRDTEPIQRAACHLFRLGVSCLFLCWLSVEVLVLALGYMLFDC